MGLFIQLKQNGFAVAPETKVLKAGEYRELVKANEIIDAAKKEAEKIIHAARQEYESKKKQGYQDGVKAAKMDMSDQMVQAVARNVDYLGSVEDKITSLIVDAVSKIIGSIDSRELIVRLVKKSLSTSIAEKQIQLRVHRDDAETVRQQMDSILKEFPQVSFLEVIGDKNLEKGSCILESETGTVDASIGVQLSAIERSLKKKFKDEKKR